MLANTALHQLHPVSQTSFASQRDVPKIHTPASGSRPAYQRSRRSTLDYRMPPAQAFEDLDRQMAAMRSQVDRQITDVDKLFGDLDRQFADADADLAQTTRRLEQDGQDLARSFRSDRPPSSRSAHFSVEVRSGSWSSVPHTVAAGGPSVALIAAAVLLGAYAAVATAFFKNFSLTLYQQKQQLPLTLLWPLLCVFSSRFRHQFFSAIRGVRPPLEPEIGEGGDNSSRESR